MKSIPVFIVCLFFVTIAHSQIIDDNFSINSINGQIWVLDSTHQYSPNYMDSVFLKYRQLVTSRNDQGFVTSKLSLIKRTESGEWAKSSRSTTTYYDNGRKKEYFLQIYDITRNIWIDSIQYKSYTDKGLVNLDIYKGWNTVAGKFIYGNKVSKQYNEDGKLISKLTSKWSTETENWINNKKINSEYNSEGKVVKEIIQVWSKDDKKWINSKKHELKYNDDGYKIEYISLIWINDAWQNSFKKSIFYAADNKVVSILNQYWNKSVDDWENYIQYSYTYDGQNRIKEVGQSWDTLSKNWFDFEIVNKRFEENLLVEEQRMYYSQDTSVKDSGFKTFKEYNPNKKLSLVTKLKWIPDTNSWQNIKKIYYTYNSGKTTIISKWDNTKLEWIKDVYYQYLLNEDGQTKFSIKKKWSETKESWENVNKNERKYDDFKHNINSNEYLWDTDSESWNLTSRTDYFWSKFTTSLARDLPKYDFDFYPNPVTDILFLNIDYLPENATIQVFDINGKMLKNIITKSANEIDVSNFHKGSYFLRIVTDERIFSKLFVVE